MSDKAAEETQKDEEGNQGGAQEKVTSEPASAKIDGGDAHKAPRNFFKSNTFYGCVATLLAAVISAFLVIFFPRWFPGPPPPAFPRPLTAVITNHQSPIEPNERIVFSAIDTITDHPVSKYDWMINWFGFKDFGGCFAVGPDTTVTARIDCGFRTTGRYTVSLRVENSANEQSDTEVFLHVKCDGCMHGISVTSLQPVERKIEVAYLRELLYGVKWKDYIGVLDAPIILVDPDKGQNVFARSFEEEAEHRNVDRPTGALEGRLIRMVQPDSIIVSDKERYIQLLSDLRHLGVVIEYKSDQVALSYPPSSPYPPREVDLASHRFIIDAGAPEGFIWTDPVSLGLRDYEPSGKFSSGSNPLFFGQKNLASTFYQMNIPIPRWARTEIAEPPVTFEMRLIENIDQPLIAYYDLPLPGSPEFEYALQENIAEGEELLRVLEKRFQFEHMPAGVPEKEPDWKDVWDTGELPAPSLPAPGSEMNTEEWIQYVQTRLDAFYELRDHQKP